jgi:hypothetical protein
VPRVIASTTDQHLQAPRTPQPSARGTVRGAGPDGQESAQGRVVLVLGRVGLLTTGCRAGAARSVRRVGRQCRPRRGGDGRRRTRWQCSTAPAVVSSSRRIGLPLLLPLPRLRLPGAAAEGAPGRGDADEAGGLSSSSAAAAAATSSSAASTSKDTCESMGQTRSSGVALSRRTRKHRLRATQLLPGAHHEGTALGFGLVAVVPRPQVVWHLVLCAHL